MTTVAKVRGLAGLVIDGCVRDGVLLREIGFPVFARGLCIQGTGKDFGAIGWVNAPVLIGDVAIAAGDLIVGDEDGVVALPQAMVEKPYAPRSLGKKEAEMCRQLEAGATTLELLGLI